MVKNFIILSCSVALLTSCRSTRNIQTAIAKKDTVTVTRIVPVDHSHDDSVAFINENFNGLLKNRISFTTFSAKVEVDYEDAEGKKYNVTSHIRMYKDSIIWVSITGLLGIEGLRAIITSDSVKVIDKQNKTYTARSVSYLQDVSALPLTLSSLQDLLIGNPVFLDSTIVSYSRSQGIISLFSTGEFFKNQVNIGETDRLIQSSKLDDLDEMKNRSCYLTYADYETKNGISFPTRRTISVAEKKKLDIKLDFRNYDFNETLSFPFSVPKSYKTN